MEMENVLIPLNEEICGATHITSKGREFICVLPPHPRLYTKRAGGGIYKHLMVNRWPYREPIEEISTYAEQEEVAG